MKSTLTGGSTMLVKSLPLDYVQELYLKYLNFDIKDYVKFDQIQLFRCNDTGFEFYEPRSAMGTPFFYEQLYKDAKWAYQDSKWEYNVASQFVKTGDRVLDVGSGAGQFLTCLHGVERVGLETNAQGRALTPERIVALDQTIEIHAVNNKEYYDFVSAIQVLEHIYDVKSFLEGCCRVLKTGGILVLSVPNNDGFVGRQTLPLNMPPHHMGRWSRRSLSALTTLFPLELLRIENEPLQEANVGWYLSWMEDEFLPRSRVKRSLFHRLGFSSDLRRWIMENRTTIMGHTILAAYRKTHQQKAAAQRSPTC